MGKNTTRNLELPYTYTRYQVESTLLKSKHAKKLYLTAKRYPLSVTNGCPWVTSSNSKGSKSQQSTCPGWVLSGGAGGEGSGGGGLGGGAEREGDEGGQEGARHSKVRQGKARQGKARRGKAKQGQAPRCCSHPSRSSRVIIAFVEDPFSAALLIVQPPPCLVDISYACLNIAHRRLFL